MQRLLALLAVVAFGAALWLAVRPAFEDDAGGRSQATTIDDRRGRYHGVGIGDGVKKVRDVLGRRAFAKASEPFAPRGEDFVEAGGPTVVGSSCKPRRSRRWRSRVGVLRYDGVAFLLCRGRVFALMITADDAVTTRGVGVGDGLDRVRPRYGSARCGDAPAGEGDTYSYCASPIGPRGKRLHIWFGEDAIKSITLSKTRFGGYEPHVR